MEMSLLSYIGSGVVWFISISFIVFAIISYINGIPHFMIFFVFCLFFAAGYSIFVSSSGIKINKTIKFAYSLESKARMLDIPLRDDVVSYINSIKINQDDNGNASTNTKAFKINSFFTDSELIQIKELLTHCFDEGDAKKSKHAIKSYPVDRALVLNELRPTIGGVSYIPNCVYCSSNYAESIFNK